MPIKKKKPRYELVATLAKHKCRARVARIKRHLDKQNDRPVPKYEVINIALDVLETELGLKP